MSKRKSADEDGRTGEATKRRPSRFEPAEAPSVPALPLEVVAIQAQLAAQIAAASAISESVKPPPPPPPPATASLGAPAVKKTVQYHSLRLDAQGREVDEHGNVVKIEGPAKTVALNAAAVAVQSLAQRKKDNPYLAHRHNAKASSAKSADPAATATATATAASSQLPFILDEHIPYTARDSRAKKALKFADAGTFIEKEEAVRAKEERRIKSGFASGRNKPQLISGPSAGESSVTEGDLQRDDAAVGQQQEQQGMPPSADDGSVPSIEWWDEAFLPKEMRDAKKAGSKEPDQQLQSPPLDSFLAPSNCKTLRLVQHPPAIKALGGDKPEKTMPIFLTKKEQKRVRKTRRQQVEQDRRDKQMMGLLPAPEPKFKLSNFMRILGDQAVADPSKVEARVLQQVKQREIAHEMRNLAAKLTPAERREKKAKKALEAAATVRQITVATFGVKSLANPRHRFKVDMNARQYYLTGTVVLCPGDSMNLVYVEGGPKGIRKFVRLMMNRIQWDEEPPAARVIEGEDGDVGADTEAGEKEAGGSDMDSDSDESDGDDDGKASQDGDKTHRTASTNRCELLWQGAVAKRLFTGIKFQECTSKETARRVLEDRHLGHFWDLVDSSLGAGAGSGSVLDLV